MNKAHISLFTCATAQAVHLELRTDMSTDRFLMAVQRFVGRCGLPTQSIQTTREHSTLQTFSFPNFVTSYPPPRPISSSPTMAEYGNLTIRELLVGEDGGRVW